MQYLGTMKIFEGQILSPKTMLIIIRTIRWVYSKGTNIDDNKLTKIDILLKEKDIISLLIYACNRYNYNI